MLPHGAQHPGGMAVPAIRVGVGGHRPRRTSQLVLIRSSKHARGTARRAVEGAFDSTPRCRLRSFVDARAPSTALLRSHSRRFASAFLKENGGPRPPVAPE